MTEFFYNHSYPCEVHLSIPDYTSRVDSQEPGSTYATAEWENLPLKIVDPTLDKLYFEPGDHVRFAAVCKQWNTRAEYYKINANQHGRWHTKELVPPPMLLFRKKTQATLYSVSEGKAYNNGELLDVDLAVPGSKFFQIGVLDSNSIYVLDA